MNKSAYRLLDDLSQITFVLDDMSQKGAICTKIYGRFVTILFSTWTICQTFILDDLSQVTFVKIVTSHINFVIILFWTRFVVNISFCPRQYVPKKETLVWGD